MFWHHTICIALEIESVLWPLGPMLRRHPYVEAIIGYELGNLQQSYGYYLATLEEPPKAWRLCKDERHYDPPYETVQF